MILFIPACQENDDREKAGGTLEICNSTKPKLGTIELELEPLLKIASAGVPAAGGAAFFTEVKKDSKGNFYFLDYRSVCIHKFDPRGGFEKNFLRKGGGPGELTALEGFTIIADVIFCSNRTKYCCFDAQGNLVKNVQLAMQHNGVIEHVDLNRYITYQNIQAGNKNAGSRCLLVDIDQGEREIFRKMIPDIGYSVLKMPSKDFRYITESTPRIQYRFNPRDRLIYCFYNFDYAVSLVDLDGNVKKIVTRPHRPVSISAAEIDEFAASYKRQGWTPLHIAVFKKDPPEKSWPAIRNIRLLANGYWGAIRVLSLNEKEMDVFDAQGEFQYIVRENEKIEDIEAVSFFQDRIGMIHHGEDGDFYTEYRVKHPPRFISAQDVFKQNTGVDREDHYR